MSAAAIEHHVTQAERRLVDALDLQRMELPAHLAQATGRWKDAPVRITTRAYTGDAVGYMRVALVNGVNLSIGNLLAQARPNRPLPVLGADLVWLGAGRDTMIAADLSSMREGPAREAEHRAIAAAVPDVSALPPGGELPPWCQLWFSPAALYTRVSAERLEEALSAFDGYVDAWLTLAAAARPAPESADEIRARQLGYARAHQAEDKGLGLLATMFGRAWADEYLDQVLFPVAAAP